MKLTPEQASALFESLDQGDMRVLRSLHLPLLGTGIARTAYRLEVEGYPARALKVETGSAPDRPWYLEQMHCEVSCLLAMADHPFIPALLAWGPDEDNPVWAVVELLRPSTAPDGSVLNEFKDAFERQTGVLWREWQAWGWPHVDPDNFTQVLKGRLLPIVEAEDIQRVVNFISDIGELVGGCQLWPGELFSAANWGLDRQGYIVVADLGVCIQPESVRVARERARSRPKQPMPKVNLSDLVRRALK